MRPWEGLSRFESADPFEAAAALRALRSKKAAMTLSSELEEAETEATVKWWSRRGRGGATMCGETEKGARGASACGPCVPSAIYAGRPVARSRVRLPLRDDPATVQQSGSQLTNYNYDVQGHDTTTLPVLSSALPGHVMLKPPCREGALGRQAW